MRIAQKVNAYGVKKSEIKMLCLMIQIKFRMWLQLRPSVFRNTCVKNVENMFESLESSQNTVCKRCRGCLENYVYSWMCWLNEWPLSSPLPRGKHESGAAISENVFSVHVVEISFNFSLMSTDFLRLVFLFQLITICILSTGSILHSFSLFH